MNRDTGEPNIENPAWLEQATQIWDSTEREQKMSWLKDIAETLGLRGTQGFHFLAMCDLGFGDLPEDERKKVASKMGILEQKQ